MLLEDKEVFAGLLYSKPTNSETTEAGTMTDSVVKCEKGMLTDTVGIEIIIKV